MESFPELPDISPVIQDAGYLERNEGNRLALQAWDTIVPAGFNRTDRVLFQEIVRERIQKLLWLAHSQVQYGDRVTPDATDLERMTVPERTFLDLLNGIIAHTISEMCEGRFVENTE